MTDVNETNLLADPANYFAGSYRTFLSFGGPSIYFHHECLRACQAAFLSQRHLEMLYATLTAWGMHRMGDPSTTKTKLAEWETFRSSICSQRNELERFRGRRMTAMSERDYAAALNELKSVYMTLRLSVSKATVVVNSKALFHLFPDLVPPIDRQHTIRFFKLAPSEWLTKSGKLTTIVLPTGKARQFELFARVCASMKRLADRRELAPCLEAERRRYGITPPKALDNAIMNYVKSFSTAATG